jgi:hypothetical protein
MKNWFNKNYKTIIIFSFLIPIITVAVVSITHVTKWYGISNPLTWAIYLSIGIEIAALSSLAAISVNMGNKVYFPFGIVTLIQFIGNIYFAYSYIDINSQSFISWVELVSPLLEYIGVEPTDLVGHKRFLSFFSGGMLPIISLTFLHMLVKFTQEEKKISNEVIDENLVKNDTIEGNEEIPTIDSKEIISEVSRVRLSEDDLNILEKILSKKNNQTTPKPTKKETIIDQPIINNSGEMIKKWEENEDMNNLTPIKEDSPIIDLIKSNDNQIVTEFESTDETASITQDESSVESEPTKETIVNSEQQTELSNTDMDVEKKK